MAPQTQQVFTSKTQHYLKVQKPLLERQRRARINKCLDSLKTLVAEFQGDDAILRMDKAEMLEAALVFMRKEVAGKSIKPVATPVPMDSFKNGYMNAVNEVSRVMACTPSMNVEIGKAVMTQLGCEFQHLLRADAAQQQQQQQQQQEQLKNKQRPVSPASSGYHSDCEDIEMISPNNTTTATAIWRPW